ncbi:hypothetical protein DDZ14_16145 [Maritimibacter sp. 55A14]|nr:hypothetical protein DDZ14_16145 [Maritimibacter sp. 55A14]
MLGDTGLAMMAQQALAEPGADAEAPEWVHLLPAGAIQTADARGPYSVADAEALIAVSFTDTDRLVLDENHATDLAAPSGAPAPARGWIVEMQARPSGIWGRVEWNAAGRELVATKAYRGISPVILHDRSGRIVRILRASLVNKPNLRGLTALNQESDMTLMERLAEILGLDKASTEAQIIAAVREMKGGKAHETAAQAQLPQIAAALGLEGDATPEVVLAAAQARTSDTDVVAALQAELGTVTKALNDVTSAQANDRATAFVDGEIKRGRVGVKALRDHYIAMHMADSARVEKEIGALPLLAASGTTIQPPAPKEGEVALNAEQAQVAKLLGQDPKDYAATLEAERANEETF